MASRGRWHKKAFPRPFIHLVNAGRGKAKKQISSRVLDISVDQVLQVFLFSGGRGWLTVSNSVSAKIFKRECTFFEFFSFTTVKACITICTEFLIVAFLQYIICDDECPGKCIHTTN